jgi:hypothetical protein
LHNRGLTAFGGFQGHLYLGSQAGRDPLKVLSVLSRLFGSCVLAIDTPQHDSRNQSAGRPYCPYPFGYDQPHAPMLG